MERGVFRGNLEEKQCAVFQQVLEGKKSREIAQILQISTKEVEQTVRRTCNQLGVSNRMDAARAMAAHYGWTQHTRPNEGNRRSRPDCESTPEHPHTIGKGGATSSTQRDDIPHVQDVGGFEPMRSGRTAALGKSLSLFGLQSSETSLGHTRRILLIVVLIVGSTLALSALISAMQGFDKLVS